MACGTAWLSLLLASAAFTTLGAEAPSDATTAASEAPLPPAEVAAAAGESGGEASEHDGLYSAPLTVADFDMYIGNGSRWFMCVRHTVDRVL